MTRIESWALPGVPDVMGCDDQGLFFLVELKTTSTNAVRLSAHQISFMTTHQHAPVWVLVHQSHRNGESVFLYHGRDAKALSEQGLTLEPTGRFDAPVNWESLLSLINA